MQTLQETLRDYENSYAGLRLRIAELGEQIAQEKQAGRPVQMLVQRRNLLYTECAEMLPAIHDMQDYLREERTGEQAG